MNLDHPTVSFTLGRFDLYELTHSLDSVVLEYSGGFENTWHPFDTVYQKQMVDHYELTRTVQNEEPTFPVRWTPEVIDATYEVRAVAYGSEGFPEYSNHSTGTIDKITPYYTGNIYPEDDTVRYGSVVKLVFTEEIAQESLSAGTIEINQLIDLDKNSAGRTSKVQSASIQTDMYLALVNGNELEIYFDEAFTSNFDGAEIEFAVNGLTDLNGNAMGGDIVHAMTVKNEAAEDGVTLNLKGINLQGRQLPDGTVELTWNNVAEDHADYYVIERSADAGVFDRIGEVNSHPVNDYQFLEYFPINELAYYRIMSVDAIGEVDFSRIIVVLDNGFKVPVTVEVFPNPVENDELQFRMFSKGAEEDYQVQVMDMKGKLINDMIIAGSEVGKQQSVALPKDLKGGIYLLRIAQGSDVKVVKFVKK